jgi:hypothetical protein
MAHVESCKICKDSFLKFVTYNFGSVECQWSTNWPCKIDDVLKINRLRNSTSLLISKIYTTLQNNRGFTDFVKCKYLPPCDYYIPSLNCIIEFDESQHFTFPRKLSLAHYPKQMHFGFSIKDWIMRSELLDRHDNSPPCRDEKRAWYDTLRDILPHIFGLNPTVRFYAKQKKWCKDYDIGSFIRSYVNGVHK